MGRGDLPMSILQNIGICSLQYSRQASAKTGCMIAQPSATASCLNPDQPDFFVADKLMEDTNSIRATADAGNYGGGQAAFSFQNLCPCLVADHGMEIAHHGGIRMCAQNASKQIMRGADIGDPVAHRFIDGVLEGARA